MSTPGFQGWSYAWQLIVAMPSVEDCSLASLCTAHIVVMAGELEGYLASFNGAAEMPVVAGSWAVVEERRAAVEEQEGSQARRGLCHQPRLPAPLEGGKLYTLQGDFEDLFSFIEVRGQLQAATKMQCKYCSGPGASARCVRKGCGAHPCVRQKVEGLPSPPDAECVICFDEVTATDGTGRDCLQRLACRSGLQHFKCHNF